MSLAHLKNMDIFYREFGQGFPLICIMGLGANLDYWSQGMLDGMAEYRRVIIFDNRGVSGSSGGNTKINMASMAADTIEFMDSLGIGKADIFGVSMGGMIAQEIALTHPNRVEKLILACTSMGSRHLGIPWALMPIATQKGTRQKQRFLLFPLKYQRENAKKVKEFMQRALQRPIDQKVFLQQLLASMLFSSRDRLKNISVPTLVMTGDQDVLVNKSGSIEIAKRIKGAELEIYEGGGHGFMLQETGKVLDRIRAFLVS